MAASDHQMIDGDDKAVKTKISATHHTHSDYSQLTTVLRDGSAHPRVTPRGNDRKHLHQKMATRGNHIFDGLVIR